MIGLAGGARRGAGGEAWSSHVSFPLLLLLYIIISSLLRPQHSAPGATNSYLPPPTSTPPPVSVTVPASVSVFSRIQSRLGFSIIVHRHSHHHPLSIPARSHQPSAPAICYFPSDPLRSHGPRAVVPLRSESTYASSNCLSSLISTKTKN